MTERLQALQFQHAILLRLKKDGTVYGWPSGGYPAPQGPFYCAVGSESVYGRPLAEAHMDACIKVRTACATNLSRKTLWV